MNDKIQTRFCPVCQMNLCACSDKIDESDPKTLDENSKEDEKIPKTKPPKISWI